MNYTVYIETYQVYTRKNIIKVDMNYKTIYIGLIITVNISYKTRHKIGIRKIIIIRVDFNYKTRHEISITMIIKVDLNC